MKVALTTLIVTATLFGVGYAKTRKHLVAPTQQVPAKPTKEQICVQATVMVMKKLLTEHPREYIEMICQDHYGEKKCTLTNDDFKREFMRIFKICMDMKEAKRVEKSR